MEGAARPSYWGNNDATSEVVLWIRFGFFWNSVGLRTMIFPTNRTNFHE
ncbi:MAG: hypothetical protein ACI92G_004328 [Candidatus Pelagisphaera sp.]|jgi:hypothetical protein